MPDKTANSAAKFLLEDVIEPCPYLIECVYSDNGINQKFTKPARPQTNDKAERVIRTLMEMWHDRMEFIDSEHRKKELCRFINFYNTVKPHAGLNGDTPFEVLKVSFSTHCVNNAMISNIFTSLQALPQYSIIFFIYSNIFQPHPIKRERLVILSQHHKPFVLLFIVYPHYLCDTNYLTAQAT